MYSNPKNLDNWTRKQPIISAFASMLICRLKLTTATEVSAAERLSRAENKPLDIYSYRTIVPSVSSVQRALS